MKRAGYSQRRGGAAVYTAIVIFVVIGFVGLAVDWGLMTWSAQKLQNAADAAAMAGAREVWSSHNAARDAALNVAGLNEAGGASIVLNANTSNDPDGDVVIGQYDREAATFTPTTDATIANAVRVVARRTTGSEGGPLSLIFGPIFGKNSSEVARYAIAVCEGGPAESSIIALNDHDPKSFYIYGNGYVDLGEGSAQVNSDSGSGSVFQGTQITLLAGEVNMVGNYDEKGNPEVEQGGVDLNPHEDYVPDPLAQLPDPAFGSPMTPSVINGSNQSEYYPGYYPNGLSVNNDNVFLHPGVYVLGSSGGKAFDHRGSATLTAYGVMFFIDRGSVTLNGTGDIHVTPPAEGVYQGIQFFQARDNTSMASFNGTGLFTGEAANTDSGAGTLYFPEAKVEVGGTGDMYIDSIISDKIHVYGDGHKYITSGYDGAQGGDKVYLIE